MAPGRCWISIIQQSKLPYLFVAHATARTGADMVDIHRNSAELQHHKLSMLIANKIGEVEAELAVFEREESYFGGAR